MLAIIVTDKMNNLSKSKFMNVRLIIWLKHYIDRALSGKTDNKPSFLQQYQKFYTKENNFEIFTI